MTDEAERMQILDMIESGKISAEDGLELLRALVFHQDDAEQDDSDYADGYEESAQSDTHISFTSSLQDQAASQQNIPLSTRAGNILDDHTNEQTEFTGQAAEETATQTASSIPIETEKWRRFWMIPFWIGVVILVIGGGLMYWALESNGIGVAFIFATLPFIFGLGIILLSWQSRTSPWIHLRITQAAGEKPERIAISFPLPIRPALWFFRTFGGHIPKMQDISLDEILLAVNRSTNSDNPIFVQVDEGDNGEKVEIYIG